MSDTLKIAAAYVRVSTEDQTELSPDTQVQKIRQYAKNRGYFIPNEFIFHDDGISGRSTKKRHGFNQMITVAKTDPKPFDAILVWKFSRFARNREDSIVYKSMLKKRGIDVISVSEDVGDDKMSILIESLIEAMDEYYSVNLSEEVVRGMSEKVRRGQAVSAPPLGYKIADGKFLIDTDTEPLIRRIFSEYLQGKPTRKIAIDLNADGYTTRRGNRFENRTVQYIIENPVYAGFIRWDIDGRGSRSYYRDNKEMVVKGTHEPYLDAETYQALQARLAEDKRIHKKYERNTATKNEWALRGLVHCSACGGTLCMAANGTSVQCYRYAHGKCDTSHSITVNKLTNAVIQSLKDGLNETALNIEFSMPKAEITVDYEKQIKREQEKLERIKAAFVAGVDTLEEYQINKGKILGTIAELKIQQEKEVPKLNKEDMQKEIKEKMKNAIQLLESPIASEEEKNAALRAFVSRIIFSRPTSSVSIYYFI